MRLGLVIAIVMACASLDAQDFEQIEVVQVDSTRSAIDLYRTAERWFVDTFNDAQEVVQLRDTTSHLLVGKGRGRATMVIERPAYASAPVPWSFSLEVQTKDGRYRVKVYDVAVEGDGMRAQISDKPCCLAACDYVPKSKAEQKSLDNCMPGYLSVCEQMRNQLASLLSSLNRAMSEQQDDW